MSNNLKVGTYYYREVEAPNGYIMDTKEYEFKITSRDQVINKTVYNEKEELPVTGGFISTDILIIIAVTIISIIGYSIYNVLRTKKM